MNKKNLPKAIRQTADDMREAAAGVGAAEWREAGPADPREWSGRGAAASHPDPVDNVIEIAPKPAVASAHVADAVPPPAPASGAIDAARRLSLAQKIVERHAAYSAVGGIIPLPLANVASVTTLIVRMVKVLSDHYGVPFERDRARAIVIGLMGGAMPTGFGVVTTTSLLHLVPGANLIGLAVCSVTAAACTRSIGRIFVEHFESGATLDDFSAVEGS